MESSFPIVKMEWINGLTLGEFINKNHNDSCHSNKS